MKYLLKGSLVLAGLALAGSACSPQQTSQENDGNTTQADTLVSFSVRPAPEWTDMFYRKDGWFGADGIFTMALSGDESIGAAESDSVFMYFSDTMTGRVLGDTAVENFKMVNNSFAWVTAREPSEGSVKIQVNRDENGSFINYFSPTTPDTGEGEYYWFGDGFVNAADDHSINIFGYRVFDTSEESWAFEVRGVTLLTIPAGEKPPFSGHSQIDLPLYLDLEDYGKGTFGSGVYVNTEWAGAPDPDGYLYVYGLLDPHKYLVVARVRPEEVKEAEAWRFWTGTDWSADIRETRPVTDRVSNELSLTPLKDGRYLLVFQADGIGEHTAIRIAETPVGPFGPLQEIWHVPEIADPPGIIPYNAKAHPVLSTQDELLISYNTISLDYFNDILRYPHIYRPRFFWLKIEE